MRKLPADLIPALLAAAYHQLSESVCNQSSEIGDDDIAIADSAGARRAGRHEDGGPQCSSKIAAKRVSQLRL